MVRNIHGYGKKHVYTILLGRNIVYRLTSIDSIFGYLILKTKSLMKFYLINQTHIFRLTSIARSISNQECFVRKQFLIGCISN